MAFYRRLTCRPCRRGDPGTLPQCAGPQITYRRTTEPGRWRSGVDGERLTESIGSPSTLLVSQGPAWRVLAKHDALARVRCSEIRNTYSGTSSLAGIARGVLKVSVQDRVEQPRLNRCMETRADVAASLIRRVQSTPALRGCVPSLALKFTHDKQWRDPEGGANAISRQDHEHKPARYL